MKKLLHKIKKSHQPYNIRQNENHDQKVDPPGRRRSMPSYTSSSGEDREFSIDPTAAFLGHMSGSFANRVPGGGGSTAGRGSSLGNAPESRDTSKNKHRGKHHQHAKTKEEEKEPTEFQLNFGVKEFDTSDEDALGEDDDSFGADELLPSMAQTGGHPPTATSAESSISALSNSNKNNIHHHSMTASASILRQDKIADRKRRGGSSHSHRNESHGGNNNSYNSRYNNSSSSRHNSSYQSSQRSTSQRSVSMSNHSSGLGTVDFTRRRYDGTDDEAETSVHHDDNEELDDSKLARAYENLKEAERKMAQEANVKRTTLSRENSPKPRRSTMKDFSSSSLSKIQSKHLTTDGSGPSKSSLTQKRKVSSNQRQKTRRASLGSPTSASSNNSANAYEMADELSHSLGQIEQFVRLLHRQDSETRKQILSETLQRNPGLKSNQTAINTSLNSSTNTNTRLFMKNNTLHSNNNSKSNKFDASMNLSDLHSSVRFDNISNSSPDLPTRRRLGSTSDTHLQLNNSNSTKTTKKGISSHSMNDISQAKTTSRRSTVANASMQLNARAASRFGILEDKINKRRHDFSRSNPSKQEDLEMSQSLNDATKYLARENKNGSRRRRRHSLSETGTGETTALGSTPMSSVRKQSRRSMVALGSTGHNITSTDDSGSSLSSYQQQQQQLLAWQNKKNTREVLPTLMEARSAHHRHPTRSTNLSSNPAPSKPRQSMKEINFVDKYANDEDLSTVDHSMKSSSKRKHKKKRKGSLSPSWRKRLVHSLGGKQKKDRMKDASAKGGDSGKSKTLRRRQSIGSSRDLHVQENTRERRTTLVEFPLENTLENPLRRSRTAEVHVDNSKRSHASRVQNNDAGFRRSHTATGMNQSRLRRSRASTEMDRSHIQRSRVGTGMDQSHNDHRIKKSGRRNSRHSRSVSTSRNRTSKGNGEKTMDYSGRIASSNDHMKTDFGEVIEEDEIAMVDSSSKRHTSKKSGRSRSLRPKMRTIKKFVGL